MSKIKLLLDVVQDMRSLADSLQAVADAIAENEPADTPEENTGKKPKKADSKKRQRKSRRQLHSLPRRKSR